MSPKLRTYGEGESTKPTIEGETAGEEKLEFGGYMDRLGFCWDR